MRRLLAPTASGVYKNYACHIIFLSLPDFQALKVQRTCPRPLWLKIPRSPLPPPEYPAPFFKPLAPSSAVLDNSYLTLSQDQELFQYLYTRRSFPREWVGQLGTRLILYMIVLFRYYNNQAVIIIIIKIYIIIIIIFLPLVLWRPKSGSERV